MHSKNPPLFCWQIALTTIKQKFFSLSPWSNIIITCTSLEEAALAKSKKCKLDINVCVCLSRNKKGPCLFKELRQIK